MPRPQYPENLLTNVHVFRRYFKYNPKDGTFLNKQTGQILGKSRGGKGYKSVTIAGKRILVHRLAWFSATGIWAKKIDHINRDPSDNRGHNLRSVARWQNALNTDYRRVRHINGFWYVYIGGRCLGRYNSLDRALTIRDFWLSKLLPRGGV